MHNTGSWLANRLSSLSVEETQNPKRNCKKVTTGQPKYLAEDFERLQRLLLQTKSERLQVQRELERASAALRQAGDDAACLRLSLRRRDSLVSRACTRLSEDGCVPILAAQWLRAEMKSLQSECDVKDSGSTAKSNLPSVSDIQHELETMAELEAPLPKELHGLKAEVHVKSRALKKAVARILAGEERINEVMEVNEKLLEKLRNQDLLIQDLQLFKTRTSALNDEKSALIEFAVAQSEAKRKINALSDTLSVKSQLLFKSAKRIQKLEKENAALRHSSSTSGQDFRTIGGNCSENKPTSSGERKRSENASPSSDRDEAVMPQEQRSTLPQEENSGEADNRFGSMADSKKTDPNLNSSPVKNEAADSQEVKQPEPKHPESKVPEPKDSEPKDPEINKSEIKHPALKDSDPKVPEPKHPGPKDSDPKVPEPNDPGLKDSETKNPERVDERGRKSIAESANIRRQSMVIKSLRSQLKRMVMNIRALPPPTPSPIVTISHSPPQGPIPLPSETISLSSHSQEKEIPTPRTKDPLPPKQPAPTPPTPPLSMPDGEEQGKIIYEGVISLVPKTRVEFEKIKNSRLSKIFNSMLGSPQYYLVLRDTSLSIHVSKTKGKRINVISLNSKQKCNSTRAKAILLERKEDNSTIACLRVVSLARKWTLYIPSIEEAKQWAATINLHVRQGLCTPRRALTTTSPGSKTSASKLFHITSYGAEGEKENANEGKNSEGEGVNKVEREKMAQRGNSQSGTQELVEEDW